MALLAHYFRIHIASYRKSRLGVINVLRARMSWLQTSRNIIPSSFPRSLRGERALFPFLQLHHGTERKMLLRFGSGAMGAYSDF